MITHAVKALGLRTTTIFIVDVEDDCRKRRYPDGCVALADLFSELRNSSTVVAKVRGWLERVKCCFHGWLAPVLVWASLE